jgi:heat shock protein HslJ
MKFINLILLAFIFLLLGCEKGDNNLIEDDVDHEEIELNNTVWVIDQTNEIPVRTTSTGRIPTLHFKDNVMGVGTNCNIAFSDYELKGNTIKFGGLATTYIYCTDMEIEAYFGTKIKSISSYIHNNGKLYLFIGKKQIGSFNRLDE